MARRYDAITDVTGIHVGHWTHRRAATGCSVVLCPAGATGGVDVRGGAPGTRETDLMRPSTLVQQVHAVVLTGGSAFGLDAAAGVMRWCEERGIGFRFGGAIVPIVAAAVLFDLGIGRADLRPDAAAGYAAAQTARGGAVRQGSVGAGTGATVAKALGLERCLKGGIGSASESTDSGWSVGALVAVNAAGDVLAPDGALVAGPRLDDGGMADTVELLRRGITGPPPMGNTTLAVVATDAKLDKEQCNRLAMLAHDGFARAIRPVHSLGDGDVVFALATGERDAPSRSELRALEALTPLAVERAIIKGVLQASSLAGIPSVGDWRRRIQG